MTNEYGTSLDRATAEILADTIYVVEVDFYPGPWKTRMKESMGGMLNNEEATNCLPPGTCPEIHSNMWWDELTDLIKTQAYIKPGRLYIITFRDQARAFVADKAERICDPEDIESIAGITDRINELHGELEPIIDNLGAVGGRFDESMDDLLLASMRMKNIAGKLAEEMER